MSRMAPASSTPVGPPPTITKFSGGCVSCLHRLPLRQLVCQHDAAAHLRRILQRLQSRRELRPVIVPEIAVRRARCQDQIVVVDFAPLRSCTVCLRSIEADRLVHQHFDVLLVPQNGADGLRDIGRRQHARRRPDRAAAGRCDDCAGRSPSHRQPCRPAPALRSVPQSPPPAPQRAAGVAVFFALCPFAAVIVAPAIRFPT